MDKLINRRPAVAGKFYAGNKSELIADLKNMFKTAKQNTSENTIAIISPHAGYVFSGEVAASSFMQIDSEKNYQNIFIIGTSHQTYLKGATVYNKGNYITPIGEVKVNLEIANKLIQENDFFEYDQIAHSQEHSLEVQLPFLQHRLKTDFKIVPIIIGTNSNEIIKKIAETLKPYFTDDNLFVISTDFSHYPSYNNAVKVDNETAKAIISNSAVQFLEQIKKNKEKNIPKLATSICGWSATLALLYLTADNPKYHDKIIDYKNSGDAIYGDKDGVVGYYSIAIETSGTN